MEADLLACPRLGAYVHQGGGIIAHQQQRQPWANAPLLPELLCCLAQLRAELGCNGFPVNEDCHIGAMR
jgi:hypothetical protein